MGNFYDNWLSYWDEEQEERKKARTSIHEEDLEWVRTKQDWRAALLSARETGFVSTGVTMLAEIPPGWRSGKHAHGEEAIYIVQGRGFSVVDGLRYDWDAGSCLFMPYGSPHQHFNTGPETVRYFSAGALPLERFVGLAKLVQYEEAGETYMGEPETFKMAESAVHPDHGRIVLRANEALVVPGAEAGAFRSTLKDEFTLSQPREMRTAGVPGHGARTLELMGNPQNNFKAREVEITSVLCEEPGMNSGKHGHMEALLYALQGEGDCMVDGERVPWKKGTLLQIQGPQTVHQNFNTGKVESQLLRIHFGIRAKFFQSIARTVFPYRYYGFSSHK